MQSNETPSILEQAKTALRISGGNTAYDFEISTLCEAAAQTMRYSGVSESIITSSAGICAQMLWVKAHFGNADTAQKAECMKAYNTIIRQLALVREDE